LKNGYKKKTVKGQEKYL